MKQRDICQLIETYELPPKLEERILAIALRKVEEESIDNFAQAYREISNLVDIFKTPRAERHAVRLDHAQSNDDERTYHETIGEIDRTLESISEEPVSEIIDIVPQQVLDQLEEKVDEHVLMKMKEIFGEYMTIQVGLNPEEVVQSRSVIEERAKKLFDKFMINGQVKIPRRPIKRVTFQPELRIEFGVRRFNGNPLAFFRENNDVYGRMSRRQLQQFDSGLYANLLSLDQLEEAIPEDRRFSKLDDGTGKYRGHDSPLEYLKAHQDEFRGLSRGDISRVDQGLYFGLKDTGRLHEAMVLLGSEKSEGGFRGHSSAKDYYLAHPDLAQLTRTKLRRVDNTLVEKLKEENELDNLVPKKKQNRFRKPNGKGRYNGYACPLEAFLENYSELKGVGRTKLMELSSGLYHRLRENKHLDLAIPKGGLEPDLDAIRAEITRFTEERKLKREKKVQDKTPTENYRSYSSPLDYLRAHPEVYGTIRGRGELSRVDQGLYVSLKKWQQLDDAFPRLRERTWRGFKSSGDYFAAHQEEFRGIGLDELRRRDTPLARALYRHGYLDDALKILDDQKQNGPERTIEQRIEQQTPQIA